MAKWAKLKEEFEAFQHETPYQERVDEAKDAFKDFGPKELAEKFKEVKDAIKASKDQTEQLTVTLEGLSQLLLVRFEALGFTSVKLDSGGTLSEWISPYSHVKDRDTFYTWLKENRPWERLTFPAPSLDRMVRELLEEGQPPPPGVEVFVKNRVRLWRTNE